VSALGRPMHRVARLTVVRFFSKENTHDVSDRLVGARKYETERWALTE
jgi:hypothetical protein